MGIKQAFALLFVLMASVAAADTLWLRNGEIIDGKIERKDAQNIYFKTLDGESRVIALTDVISSDTDEELSAARNKKDTAGNGDNKTPSQPLAVPSPSESASADKTADKPVATTEPARPALKKAITVDLGEGVKLELVLIRPGSFLMGSKDGYDNQKPVHKVNITKPFYMGKFEVTQDQWEEVMNGSPPDLIDGKRYPVTDTSWLRCQEFLSKLNGLKKYPGTFRLPTEAEWEYACRAGSTTRYSFGNSAAALCKYGNYCDSSNTAMDDRDTAHSDGFDSVAPVGSFPPNRWGLYDMHGNAPEWCHDFYAKYTGNEQTDPVGPATGMSRVLRYGSWMGTASSCRSASRGFAGHTEHVGGLRVVCTAGAE